MTKFQMIKVLHAIYGASFAKAGKAKQTYLENLDLSAVQAAEFSRCMQFLLDKQMVTGISDAGWDKVVMYLPELHVENTFEEDADFQFAISGFLKWISRNNTGSHAVLEKVAQFMVDYELNDHASAVALKWLVTKDNKTGIGISTWNKCCLHRYKVLTFDVMKADSYGNDGAKLGKKLNEIFAPGREFTVTHKLDGHRVVAIKRGNDVKLYSSGGKEKTGFTEIEDAIRNLFNSDIVLDGEMLPKGWEKLNAIDAYRAVESGKGIKTDSQFNVFDIMSTDEWDQQVSLLTYDTRRKLLSQLSDKIKDKTIINILPTLYVGSDRSKIMEIYYKLIAQGQEGVMVNFNDEHYHWDRGPWILKVKPAEDDCFKIIGFNPGKEGSKYEETLGALIIDYKGYQVKVAGIKDADRDYIWQNRNELLGKWADIRYTCESQDEQGNLSLRFPRFLKVRTDK